MSHKKRVMAIKIIDVMQPNTHATTTNHTVETTLDDE